MASRLQDVHLRGLIADRPLATAVAPGTLYYATDTTALWRSDGATWESYSFAADGGDIQALLDSISTVQGTILYRDVADWVALAPGTVGQVLASGGPGANPSWVNAPNPSLYTLTPPIDSDFTWVNQGGASVVADSQKIFLRAPLGVSTNLRIRIKSAPATPYTITAAFLDANLGKNYASCGLIFRESGSGKLNTMAHTVFNAGDSAALEIVKFTNPTLYSSPHYVTALPLTPVGLVWYRIADNGTNRIFSVSPDGVNWIQVFSVTRTDFLTADQVGFYAETTNNLYDMGMTLVSWKQE